MCTHVVCPLLLSPLATLSLLSLFPSPLHRFPEHVRILKKDIYEWEPPRALTHGFDVLVSDMAPKTSGISDLDADNSFDLCERVGFVFCFVLSPLQEGDPSLLLSIPVPVCLCLHVIS